MSRLTPNPLRTEIITVVYSRSFVKYLSQSSLWNVHSSLFFPTATMTKMPKRNSIREESLIWAPSHRGNSPSWRGGVACSSWPSRMPDLCWLALVLRFPLLSPFCLVWSPSLWDDVIYIHSRFSPLGYSSLEMPSQVLHKDVAVSQ